MEAGIVLLGLGLVLLTGSAVAAFAWAARAGQFEDLEAAPDVIFDADEPIGAASDCFPDPVSRAAMEQETPERSEKGNRGGCGENTDREIDVVDENGRRENGL